MNIVTGYDKVSNDISTSTISKSITKKEKEYLSKTKKSGIKKVVLNNGVFSPNFLPNNISHRKQEIEHLLEHFLPTRFQKYCSDLSLYGVTGCGKTLVMKILKDALSEGVENTFYVFVSCEVNSTSSAVCKSILNQISVKWIGSSVSGYINQIEDAISGKLLLLILDEVDLFLKRRKTNENLIEVFSNWNNCVLVFISNDPGWHDLIKDHRTISRLHLSNMIFEPYDEYDIFDIIKDRAKIGLAETSFDDNLLREISQFTAQYNGDARVAIKLLHRSAEYAEEEEDEKINTSHLNKAIDSLEVDNKLSFIKTLPPQHKVILISIYNASKNFKNPTIDAVYEEYKRLVRYHTEWRKLARHTVEVYINELETYKLIQRVVGKGRGRGKGREPTCIITTFDVKKFEEMLKR